MEVTADDGNGGTDIQLISVIVAEVNEAPTALSITNSAVNENTDTTGGYSVGTLMSTDQDAGDTFSYGIIGGADAGVFSIGGAGADELILSDGVLDYERQSVYSVTVRSIDSGGLHFDQTLLIMVDDLNEPPSFTSTAVTSGTQDVAYSYSITTTDPDAGAALTITALTFPSWLTLTDNGDGTATLAGTPTSDNVGSNSVTLQVSDGNLQANQSFSVIVSNTNDAPVITSDGGSTSALVNTVENDTAVTTVTATDADSGDIPTFSISGGDDATRFGIETNSGVVTFNTAPDFETPSDANADGTYVVEVTADDGNGGTDTQLITVVVADVNEVPTAMSISNGAVDENTDTTGGYSVGTLMSTDQDTGDTFSYSIIGGADAGVFSIGGAGADELILSDGVLDHERQSTYSVLVRSIDSGGLRYDQEFFVSVDDANEAPSFTSTAVTSGTQDVAYSYSITTTDPDAGAALTITALTFPSWLTLTDNGDGTATLAGTPTSDNVGSNSVTLQVSDGNLQANQSFSVIVSNTNDAPVITSDGGSTSALVNTVENDTAVTTVTATDADSGDIPTFSISGGDDATRFGIETNSGVVTFNTAPDFETPSDANADGTYVVEVTADDGNGGTDTQLITVVVADVNEVPTAMSISNGAVDENTDTTGGYSVGTLMSTDQDTGDTFSYSIIGGADAGVFSIGGAGADELILSDGVLDHERQSTYSVLVRSIDSGGLSYDQGFFVSVNDTNEAPSFTSTAVTSSTQDIAYNYDITTTDPDSGSNLTITASSLPAWLALTDNGNGTATLTGTPTNNDVGQYAVSLQVSDGSLQNTQSFSVTVTDVNDAPVITSNGGVAAASIVAPENQTFVTTVVANDIDSGDVPAYTITGGVDSASFGIDTNSGVVTFNTAPDFETPSDADSDGIYELEVMASDASGGTDRQLISVSLTDVNDAPTAISLDNTSVPENTDTQGGFSVGRLSSNDVDTGDTFTYSIVGGTDASVFSIGGVDADELILTDGILDFERQASYTVMLRTTDSGGLNFDQTLIISLGDLNEAPAFMSAPVIDGIEDSTYRYEIITTDPDASAVMTITAPRLPAWLTLTDNGDGTALLEGTPTNNDVGSHEVSLQVSDSSSQSTQSFMILVADTNDAPVIISNGGNETALIEVAEIETAVTTVVVNYVDQNDTTIFSISGGDDAAHFEIDAVTGSLTFTEPKAFNQPTDRDLNGRYEVSVSAEDSDGAVDTQQLSVVITAVPEINAANPLAIGAVQPSVGLQPQVAIPVDVVFEAIVGQEVGLEFDEIVDEQPELIVETNSLATTQLTEDRGLQLPSEPLSIDFPIQATTPVEPAISTVVDRQEQPSEPENRLSKLLRTWVSALAEKTQSLEDGLDRERFLDGLSQSMDAYDKQAGMEASKGKLVADIATGFVLTLTAGFVSWMLQAGSMIASLLTSMPAWRQLDLLPILSAHESDDATVGNNSAEEDAASTDHSQVDDRVDELLRKSG